LYEFAAPLGTLYNRGIEKRPSEKAGELMTTVVAKLRYQGTLNILQAQRLGASYTHLGVRKISSDESERSLSIEYDATRMDRNGLAALLRRLGIPLVEETAP
jgi:hypothetical protein